MNKNFIDSFGSEEYTQKQHGIRGEVTVTNRFGDIIFKKDNLVTLKGRLFVLEKIFGVICNSAHEGFVLSTDDLAKRNIFLYSIGNGGMTNINILNSLKPPVYNSNNLFSQLDFVRKTTSSSTTYTDYFGATSRGNDIVGYPYKLINNNKVIVYGGEDNVDNSNVADEVFIELTLTLSDTDLRWMTDPTLNGSTVSGSPTYSEQTKYFNEIGLFIASPTASNDDYTNIEMFSHLTFNSIDLITEKDLTFTYRIYVV